MADWQAVNILNDEMAIPVIGSGDICTPQGALDVLRSGVCQGVMIGRAALGNPWIFGQALDLLAGRAVRAVSPPDRYETVLQHLQLILETDGPERGLSRSRFLLLPYAKGLPGSTQFRKQMFQVREETQLRQLLHDFFA